MQASYLGKYQIISRLGRGGMGDVYKAFHPQLQRYVAIKILLTDVEAESGFTARFQNEAKAVARLRHPNIVQVFDFDIEDNRPYMVMEFVEGETLAQRMTRYHDHEQLMPTDEAVRLFQQLCSAVDYAHQQGMLHRDIKPANVIINPRNDAILTDFGIAKMAGVSGLTATGIIVGTPRYMSPEQAQGLPVDERSDVYSLSLILYELLAGKLPFEAVSPVGMVMQHIMTSPLPITAANPAVPPRLAEVALVGIAKNPNERFRSAGAMGRAIAIATTAPLAASGPAPGAYPGSGSAPAFVNNIDSLPTKISDKPDLPTARVPVPGSVEPGPDADAAASRPIPAAGAVGALTPPNAPATTPALAGTAANTPPVTLPPSSAEGAITPPLSDPASTPPVTPPPSSPGTAPGVVVKRRKPFRRVGRWVLAGTVLMLLVLAGGILAVALINSGNHASTAGVKASPPKTVIGSVTLSDADPNDFSHAANTLAADFTSLKQPTSGSAYFAWLCDAGAPTCTSLGPVSVDKNGSAAVRFSQSDSLLGSQGLNPDKLNTVITFKITQEHATSSGLPGGPSLTAAAPLPQGPSDNVVYSGHIPADVVFHLRHELNLFPKQNLFQGNTTPLATGLGIDAILLQQLGQQFQQYQAAGNLRGMKTTATYILNLISGKTGAQDWDQDGDTDIASGDDGFGLGDNVTVSRNTQGCSAQQTSYLPFVIDHACNAAIAGNSPALQRLFTAIQTAGLNIVTWATTIESIAHKAATAQHVSDVSQGDTNTLVNDADLILNGSIGDAQNQDGAHQILKYVEQMATITVSAV